MNFLLQVLADDGFINIHDTKKDKTPRLGQLQNSREKRTRAKSRLKKLVLYCSLPSSCWLILISVALRQNQRVQDNIHMWIGRWPAEERTVLLNDIPHNVTNHSGLIREAFKNIYHPIIAHVYHAHALRIHLLRGRIPMQIKSAYTTPWYDDMLPLPVHLLRCHHNLIDRDWNTSSQESAESINAPPSPTHTLPLSPPHHIPHL
jgi:hypothetical protein